jgi:hypothetical protein
VAKPWLVFAKRMFKPPVVYKLGQVESDNTQEDSSQGKNKEPEDSSS